MANNLTDSHQHDLEQLARWAQIARQAHSGQLTQAEAVEALRRLELDGVQATGLSEADLLAAGGLTDAKSD